MMLHLVKSGKAYSGFDSATYHVYLDGQDIGHSTELVRALAMAIAALYVYNVDFPKKLVGFFQFVHIHFLQLPSTDTVKKVAKLAVKLSM